MKLDNDLDKTKLNKDVNPYTARAYIGSLIEKEIEEKNALIYNEYYKELNNLLNAFSVVKLLLEYVILFVSIVICMVVIYNIGEFLFVLLIVGALLTFNYLGYKLSYNGQNKRKFAYEACTLMEQCMLVRESSTKCVSTLSNDGNISMYNKFTTMYPEMKNFKLWYLSRQKHIFY